MNIMSLGSTLPQIYLTSLEFESDGGVAVKTLVEAAIILVNICYCLVESSVVDFLKLIMKSFNEVKIESNTSTYVSYDVNITVLM